MISFYCDRFSRTDASGNSTSTILHLLAGTKNILTLPEINLKLIKACDSGQENIGEIADLIKMDPSMTLKVMDMYYSCFHKGPKKLSNLESALEIIGLDTINTLVSCSSAGSIFDGIINAKKFDLKGFWRHSLKCAFLAELISKDIPGQSSDEAFLTGLLHDIGRLVLFTSFPNIYGKLPEKTPHQSIVSKEQKILGIDHCYIGNKLIEGWHYYPFMADALLYHHHPLEKVAVSLTPVKVLYLANLMAQEEITDKEDLYETAKILCGFSRDKMEEYLLYAETRLEAASTEIGIEDNVSGQAQPMVNSKGDVRSGLANEVRDRSLIAYAFQNIPGAQDKGTVMHIIRQGFQTLFEKSSVFFFLYDKDENALIGHCQQDDDYSVLINGLRVSVAYDNSLIVSCLHNKSPLDSFSQQKKAELTITDSQLIHFTANDGILCLPLIEKDEMIGVMVIGVGKAECSFILKQATLLNSFLHQCAMILSLWNRKEEVSRQPQTVQAAPGATLSRKMIHEINNPLSVIKNYLSVLDIKLADNNIERDEIRIVKEEINRIVKMLRKFPASSDKEARMVKEPVNVNSLLLDIVKLTNGSLEKDTGIDINLDCDPLVPDIITERDNLKQVFINLIKNAVEAMPGGGRIDIKTSYMQHQERDDGEDGTGILDGRVRIGIIDDGPGISEEIRARLFKEFVTSKEGHEGLGLSIVKGIVDRINGSIQCDSLKGKGTSFVIELPLKISA